MLPKIRGLAGEGCLIKGNINCNGDCTYHTLCITACKLMRGRVSVGFVMKLKLQAVARKDGDFSLCVHQKCHVQHTDFAY